MGMFKKSETILGYFYDGKPYCPECAYDYGYDVEDGVPLVLGRDDVENYCCDTCGVALWLGEDE